MRRFILALLVLAGLILGGPRVWRTFVPSRIEVVTVRRGMAVDAAYATGSVESSVMVPLGPKQSVRITELLVDEGAVVSKGAVLARFESADLEATVRELEAHLEQARTELDRLERLRVPGAMSEQQRDNARFTRAAAEAALARAREQLSFLTIVAPADGTILRRDGEVGQPIAANSTLFWFAASADLRVTAEVDEENIPLVAVGQRVVLKADALPGEIFEGIVESITPKGDPIGRSFRVRISLPHPGNLRIGMTVETNIIMREKTNALLVPTSAVDGDHVWAIEAGALKSIPVVVGIQGDRVTEIVSGVSDRTIVAVTPHPTFTTGRRVRTVASEMRE